MGFATEPGSPSTSNAYFELKQSMSSTKKSPRFTCKFAELPEGSPSMTMRRTKSVKQQVHTKHPMVLLRELSHSVPDCSSLEATNLEGSKARTSAPQLHRVRSFRKTAKGLVNQGDTFCKTRSCILAVKKSRGVTVPANEDPSFTDITQRRRRSTPNYDACVHDATRHEGHITTSRSVSQLKNRIKEMKRFQSKRNIHNTASNHHSDRDGQPRVHIPFSGALGQNSFRVAMLGASSVGKTALTQQFTTSEYLGGFDSPTGDLETSEASVCVCLDEVQSTVRFTEQLQVTEDTIFFDGYIVVFDVTDRESYSYSVDILTRLRREHGGTAKAVILVANKTDLVRKRRVSAKEAKSVSKLNKCKYIETSAAINHHVDELLVGIASELHQQGSTKPESDRDQKFNWNECIDKALKNFAKMIWRKSSSNNTARDWL